MSNEETTTPIFRTGNLSSLIAVVNVMMLALPSMTQRMRQYERHRKALEAAGEDDIIDCDEYIDGPDGEEEGPDGDCTPPPPDSAPTPARLRRFLAATRVGRQGGAGRYSLATSTVDCYPSYDYPVNY